MRRLSLVMSLLSTATMVTAEPDYHRALKRAQYLLTYTLPSDSDFAAYASDRDAYETGVRAFLSHPNFYKAMLRYHQRMLGVGLPDDYMNELLRDEIDDKANKFARIKCYREPSSN